MAVPSPPSLCERRHVSLTIAPISYREWSTPYCCDCELVFVFKGEENAGQVKVLIEEEDGLDDVVVYDDDNDELDGEGVVMVVSEEEDGDEEWESEDEEEAPQPLPTLSLEEDSHLLKIMAGLYIAMVDDEAEVATLRTLDKKPFTHVVQVVYTTPLKGEPLRVSGWWYEEGPLGIQVQHLDLVCPDFCLGLDADEMSLDSLGLCSARDFLTLALPYISKKWSQIGQRRHGREDECGKLDQHAQDEQSDVDEDGGAQVVFLAPGGPDDLLNEQDDPVMQDDEDVNALIVAPASRAVDVLSILYCYLSFLLDTALEDLTLSDCDDRVWRQVKLGRWAKAHVELARRLFT